MKVSTRELDRIVLQALSDDYQSFDSVVGKLSRLGSFICGVYDADEVERSLLSSIAKGFVEAYLLQADPPYARPVRADPGTVRKYWYCITNEGEEYLRRIK
jgi:hypothetical protein